MPATVNNPLTHLLSRTYPAGPCRMFVGSKTKCGYGRVTYRQRNYLAHRLVASLVAGRGLEKGEVVMHTCDNTSCINPAHLRIGTQSENMYDAYAKGRR